MPKNDDVVKIDELNTAKIDKKIILTETELHDLLQQNVEEVITTIQTKEEFYGPVPHPKHMREYKSIDKSLPDRFTAMAEKNQDHRMWVEKIVVLGELTMGILGWATPTALSFYVLSAAIGFVGDEKPIEALVSLVVALGSIGGAFYMKTRSNNEDNLKNKDE